MLIFGVFILETVFCLGPSTNVQRDSQGPDEGLFCAYFVQSLNG